MQKSKVHKNISCNRDEVFPGHCELTMGNCDESAEEKGIEKGIHLGNYIIH